MRAVIPALRLMQTAALEPPRAAVAIYMLLLRSSTVEVAASTPAVHLWAQLALQLHEAPDPGAVGADVRLDIGGQLADGGEVDAEQFRALRQRRRDRPAQIWVVPGPHRTSVSNASSRVNRERCVVRQGSSEPAWAALGPHTTGTPRTTAAIDGQSTVQVSSRFRAFAQVGR
jgi:hypothetical protein